jgi:hypothetical protein
MPGPNKSFESVDTDDLKFDSEQPQNVKGDRSVLTWYQNISEYPLIVSVQVNSDGTADATASARIDINTTQTTNRVVQEIVQASTATVVASAITAIVPPDHYYQVRAASGSVSAWNEQKMGSP